ncbi:zinc finger MYM-type protein 1-like [Rosa chinensis]|uniref:zinc finger MYM-type protein 1-like n=1 Tax=Rosa chinensis TaxID=74649 RepID=UPI000D0976EB|nr:zinc finger MYM-type protein 1-like [Rosa chinensis]
MSGAKKRKKKQREEALIQSQARDIDKYFTSNKKAKGEENQNDHANEQHDQSMNENENEEVVQPANVNELNDIEVEDPKQPENEEDDVNMIEDVQHEDLYQESCFPLNIDDPGNWDKIDQNIRDFLVERGPKRDHGVELFPKDSSGRHFDSSHYKRLLPNGEKSDRRWLVYSISLDKIFCFCCKLFKTQRTMTLIGQLANEGYKDWHNLSRSLRNHEASKEHISCMTSWIELERRLQKNKTIDESLQVEINKEREHWRQVLKRIIAVVQRLAKNNLAFRGDCEKLYVENNGHFLQMIEMIVEFDPIMEEHIRCSQARLIHYTYLGPKIQNELIQMLANDVRSSIVTKVKQAKYFSVILDCTPDASHEEQMSLVIRCVDDSANSAVVEEYWIQFLKVDDTSGHGLFTELKNVLSNLELDIDDIRGQGYDNGSNMRGRHKGVQSRLLEINPRAFYTPCGCHSLNLALCDMANCCPKAMSFFGVIQRIYTLFSSSTKRWKIFKDHVEGLTVKPLSQTRWEGHVESVKPIKEQTSQIRDALVDLANTSEDPKTKSEAESLVTHELENFEFLLGMVIWYQLLYAINTVSKFLQAENMDIDAALKELKGLILFLEEYRESGLDMAMDEAKQMASELGIEAVFREKRIIRRKKQFDDSGSDEVMQSSEESFRVNYFLFIIDQARSSLQTRFEQFQKYEEIFGFLFSLERLKSANDHSLMMSCDNLENSLTHNSHSDIDGYDLFLELKILKCSLPRDTRRAIDVLNYLKKMDGCFPNAYVAYRILLTIQVTVASAERSFSKLKLIKTYLRSTMSQERLNGLAMLSIEKKVVEKLDYANIITTFASKTARQVVFK